MYIVSELHQSPGYIWALQKRLVHPQVSQTAQVSEGDSPQLFLLYPWTKGNIRHFIHHRIIWGEGYCLLVKPAFSSHRPWKLLKFRGKEFQTGRDWSPTDNVQRNFQKWTRSWPSRNGLSGVQSIDFTSSSVAENRGSPVIPALRREVEAGGSETCTWAIRWDLVSKQKQTGKQRAGIFFGT